MPASGEGGHPHARRAQDARRMLRAWGGVGPLFPRPTNNNPPNHATPVSGVVSKFRGSRFCTWFLGPVCGPGGRAEAGLWRGIDIDVGLRAPGDLPDPQILASRKQLDGSLFAVFRTASSRGDEGGR